MFYAIYIHFLLSLVLLSQFCTFSKLISSCMLSSHFFFGLLLLFIRLAPPSSTLSSRAYVLVSYKRAPVNVLFVLLLLCYIWVVLGSSLLYLVFFSTYSPCLLFFHVCFTTSFFLTDSASAHSFNLVRRSR